MLNDIDITGYDTILLDRDGTINRQRQGDYVKTWKEFEFLPGVTKAIASFAKTAKHIFIVTNQRGIGRGRMTVEQLNDIHQYMTAETVQAGGRIDGIFFATGLDETDLMRKPNIGIWQAICLQHPDIKAETTMMIGDDGCDIDFAQNCGIKGVRVDKQNVIYIKETTE